MDVKQANLRLKSVAIYAAALTTVFLWASAFPAVKYSRGYYSAESLMVMRFAFASATLGIIGLVKKINIPRKKDLPAFFAGGFVGIFMYMWLFSVGSAYIASGISSFIVASAPVFILIQSRFLLKEKVSLICWVGVGISFVGLVVIMVSQTTGFAVNIGVVLLLFAAFFTSTHSIFQRKLLKTYTPLEATTYSIFATTLFTLVFIPTLVREWQGSEIVVNLIVAYLGIFPAGIAYLSWGYALSKAEKTTYVTVFLYLVPFVASLMGYLFLGETFSIWSFLGGVVIIGGMVVTNYFGKR